MGHTSLGQILDPIWFVIQVFIANFVDVWNHYYVKQSIEDFL